ncbi:MAG: Rrf2 family transcriptional regulator [Candidatus Eisenbacteria bacterium]|nr:Rrf2 family transcriptional regulator [Candidatus Eisenbacteria bacterium]
MATLFKFSEAASLALHAMVLIAVRKGEVVKAREMSAAFRASGAHMSKVCQRLTRSGLLVAHRGVTGGFTLSRSAGRIRLYEVYEAIEGRVELFPCLFRKRHCAGKSKHDCVFGKRIMGYEKDFLRYLKTTTIARVAATSDLGGL